MDVDQLIFARDELQRKLGEKISKALTEFTEKTGFPVSGIDVTLVDTTGIGDTRKTFLLSEVECTLIL